MSQEKDNLEIWNLVRQVPDNAKKPILAGRLKGKTDINPVWRIKTLTEQFGPVGIGWYTETERWTEAKGEEKALFVHLKLYIKRNGEWSKPIEGYGGAMIQAQERSGLFFDDDAAKKAYTDAISQACRSLGIGADVYWELDATKYAADISAIDYINTLRTVQELDNAWAIYGAQWNYSKEIVKAFMKRKNELK